MTQMFGVLPNGEIVQLYTIFYVIPPLWVVALTLATGLGLIAWGIINKRRRQCAQ